MKRACTKHTIVFLYTELSEYFLSCVENLSQRPNVEIHLVHYPINQEAPFEFSFNESVYRYDRKKLNRVALHELMQQLSPHLIYCSGWIDKEYLAACRKMKSSIPVVVGLDNAWKGTLKQWAFRWLGRKFITNIFSHCWIPGKPQEEFARKIGFNSSSILKGFYSCNVAHFNYLYNKHRETKRANPAKRFIYVGRYVEAKGIKDLWHAFIQLQKETPNEWELWCLGTGAIQPVSHPKIKHLGFIQPKEMESFIANTSVFVLPSRFEPWGVVVHEFAAAGFPLLCSSEVGAAEPFLEEGKNGFVFEAGRVDGLKDTLKKMISLSDSELAQMGDRSAELAKKITPEKWTDTIMNLIPIK
jgi:glycosyltransferase involved in cell wall biosynthesis